MPDRIEKAIEMKAPPSRVWKALTDHEQFGRWFGVRIEAPFRAGTVSRGHITIKGYEHVRWEAVITAIEPERYFAFTWHPYAVDPKIDYSQEPPTLVEFTLEKTGAGTRLTVVESGFEKIPVHRRAEALRMNEGGWAAQVKNIAGYVDGAA
jgi:uncharacterized protein YndB with AHSA1/START domain